MSRNVIKHDECERGFSHQQSLISDPWPLSPCVSLHVLHLFLKPVDCALNVNDVVSDAGIVGFATDGVRFAQQLLRQKIQLSARAFTLLAETFKLVQVRTQAGYFLVDITTLGI